MCGLSSSLWARLKASSGEMTLRSQAGLSQRQRPESRSMGKLSARACHGRPRRRGGSTGTPTETIQRSTRCGGSLVCAGCQLAWIEIPSRPCRSALSPSRVHSGPRARGASRTKRACVTPPRTLSPSASSGTGPATSAALDGPPPKPRSSSSAWRSRSAEHDTKRCQIPLPLSIQIVR